MATIVCGNKRVRISGQSAKDVYDLARQTFGECRHDIPFFKNADGDLFAVDQKALPDGVYTYDAEEVVIKKLPPSSMNYASVRMKQTDPDRVILNFVPPTAVPPLPLQLMHPVFGGFVTNVRGEGPQPTAIDYVHFAALANACSNFYDDERELVQELRKIWRDYLKVNVLDEMSTGACDKKGRSATDLGVRDPRYDALVMLDEVKLGISTSRTEPQHQALGNYELNWSSARPEVKALFSDTCLPAMLIQHVGQLLLVGGAITLPQPAGVLEDLSEENEKICYQPLASTELVMLYGHDRSMAMEGVRICMAIKAAVTMLIGYYGEKGDENSIQQAYARGRGRELFRKCIPGTLHDEALEPGATVSPLNGQKRLYLLRTNERDCVVKYCQQYGVAVHKAWAQAGLAPRLFSSSEIQGGWLEVRMEWLPEAVGWKRLYDLPEEEADRVREAVLKQLKAAHNVQVGERDGQPTYGVHGDMRDNNVMVKINSEDELEEVRFIDFDWAQEEGVAGSVYPPFMNHLEVNWPKNVEAGLPMRRMHDEKLLALPQSKQVKTSQQVPQQTTLTTSVKRMSLKRMFHRVK